MKETHYKLKHRVTALFAAAVMLCSMLPGAAFAEEPTPQPTEETVQMEQQTEPSETDNGQTDESSPDPGEDADKATSETAEEQLSEEEISAAVVGSELYTDLPDAPIGSYIGNEGLPVATGKTKIGISEWPESQLEETSGSYLTAAALDNDGLTMAAPLLDGADYAIVPILAQVEYPADGSSLDLILPDSVTLLDYYGAPAEDAESLLHNEYSETSAAVLGVYVQADANFTAQLVYTAPDGSTLTKTLQVAIDRNATAEYPFPDSEIAAFAERPTPAVTSGKITKVAKVNGTWLIWFNGEPAYCCTPGADGQPKNCPTYTYVNTSMVGADQYVPGDHYGNQYRIWGGLTQLSLGMQELPPVALSAEAPSLLDSCRTIYTDAQMQIIENYPDSTAAKILIGSAQTLLEGTDAYASARGYYSMRHTLYYTQRNTGKFIIVESKAPTGYFGDWTDINHPGMANTPLGKRGYYIEITEDSDNSVIWLDNADYNADIATTDKGGTKLVTRTGVETTVTIYDTAKDPSRTYNTDNSGKAANEDSYTITPTDGVMKNDRTLGEISISKVDLDAVRYVGGSTTHGTALASGQAHGDATLDGAVYDLYAAEDITHPDGVTGVVDYSKIVDADGNPIWHTTIRDNSGQWVSDYLPVLKKDHLVASAKIENGWLCFSNLYLGKYYVVERSTGVVIPLRDGALAVSGTYPTVDSRTKAATGQTAALAKNGSGQYTDWVYKNQFSTVSKGKALDGSWTYDAYYLSFADGYLVDEHNYYITPAYSDEGWYVEKTTFVDNRQAADEQIDKTSYSANYHIHADNALAESQDQAAKGNVEISKIVSSSGQSNGLELEGAGFTFFLVSDLSKLKQFEQTRSGSYTLQSILDAYIDKTYDNEHPKWDFSAETQAIAKTYEVNADEIAAYNKTLTAAGENKNGKGDGWQPTGSANEYQLAEIFSNDTGNIRVQGLTEVTAPDGYAIAERMEFEVLPNGEVQTFEMFDDTIKVKISKVDITTNEELPGAELVIKDKDGTEIDRWISTNEPHYVEKMPAGDYTLTEITAPSGYKVAESIDFTVLPTGEMQTVVMKDAREDTPTPTPDNTPTPDHTPQPTPNTTPAPTPVPAAPTATPTPLLTIPKTGDNSSLGLLLAIAGISLAGLAVLVHKSARRKDIAPRDDDDEDTED